MLSQRQFRLGLIVNPYSGIGGALALKGSDGAHIRQQALASGADKQANAKIEKALNECAELFSHIHIFTAAGEMGQDVAEKLGIQTTVVYQQQDEQSEAFDTTAAAKAMLVNKVDLILFAGGDGTARNICEVITNACPVIGVPAGCKIHSGVYAITPKAAGKVLAEVVKGELVSLMQAEVKDIDELAFRSGKVIAKHYGEMMVPEELQYIQAVKMGGKESDELVLADIAAQVIDMMEDEPETLFVMGSGSTVDSIMREMGLANTLLGVDVVKNQALLASDLSAKELLNITEACDTKLVITLIGGQGHIFGRGNQQLSAELLKRVGKANVLVVATKTKIENLQGKPLVCDSGDQEVDALMSGPIPIITGYRDRVLYPVIDI
ncbi:ATP-NAD kinase family protein [Glaciecola sp. MH2013]|uniref:ATP-NAD kinase family protein n=1 Tax=Glaciecola sp. MH2013 TaxID=2785524 RepID=UPI00189F09F4|nr:ATP-NAD kinase family protein [Glaciecola sp. MH2013]MBF7072516.1 ATP-NAD kinase family protein [Glaciecola sp. MH2013]